MSGTLNWDSIFRGWAVNVKNGEQKQKGRLRALTFSPEMAPLRCGTGRAKTHRSRVQFLLRVCWWGGGVHAPEWVQSPACIYCLYISPGNTFRNWSIRCYISGGFKLVLTSYASVICMNIFTYACVLSVGQCVILVCAKGPSEEFMVALEDLK